MDIISIINQFVELELECGQYEGRLSSTQNGLNYAQGKGRGWESSVEYASNQVSTIGREFQMKKMQHDSLKSQYTERAKNMSPEELGNVLNKIGNMSSRGTDYKSQAYGMVYNELYSIYQQKLSSFRKY